MYGIDENQAMAVMEARQIDPQTGKPQFSEEEIVKFLQGGK